MAEIHFYIALQTTWWMEFPGCSVHPDCRCLENIDGEITIDTTNDRII